MSFGFPESNRNHGLRKFVFNFFLSKNLFSTYFRLKDLIKTFKVSKNLLST